MSALINNTTLVQRILEAMHGQIARHGLELLQRYPNDLKIYDRNTLSRCALPGAKIAWVAGDSHSHIALLGIHKEMNDHPTWLTNLCNRDRFYVLDVQSLDSFTLKEVSRELFGDLVRTPIPYRTLGLRDAFWFFNKDRRVGTFRIEFVGIGEGNRRQYRALLTPVVGVPERDCVALEYYAIYAANEMAGTLFRDLTFKWEDAIELAEAA